METKSINESFLTKVEKYKAEGRKIHPLVEKFYNAIKKQMETKEE